MFNSQIIKPPSFEIFSVYNYVQSQFTAIKNCDTFLNFTVISPTELVSINNITLDCIDKLSDISSLYIKKIHDSSISIVTIDQINKMSEFHNELLDKLYKFNAISVDVTNNIKEIELSKFNQEIQNYINYNTINKYNLLILQIIDTIKRINVYVDLVKNNI
jgi:hypothetical protein